MKQQPDNLFREKLQGFEKTAPPSAWNRIASGLGRKENSFPWLRAAAAVAILVVAAIIIARLQTGRSDNLATSDRNEAGKEKTTGTSTAPENKGAKEKEQKSTAREELKQSRPVKKPAAKPAEKKKKQALPPSAFVSDNNIAAFDPDQAVVPIESIVADDSHLTKLDTTKTALDETTTISTRVTLVYSAEEVNEKYLDKKSLEEATDESKKQSTLKNLLSKAYALKHNQDPLGELRQKKNEILALNFRNEKQRSQNR